MPAPLDGDLYSAVLHDDGILRIRIRRVWTKAEADAFFALVRPIYAEARRRFGRVCILLEVAAVQSPPVALYVRSQALALKQPGDRTAVLVATTLSKLQIKRLASNDGFGLFCDRATATAWLLAR